MSGDAYQYQLRHIKQNLDPGDALASSRAISSLAATADDAWSLLAVCALSHPLPHAEVLASGTAFSAWLMEPEQKQPAPASGRRAEQKQQQARRASGRRALAPAHPPGADGGVIDSKKAPRRPGRLAAARAQQPQQPQPSQPSQPSPQRQVRSEQAAGSERPPAMSRLDLPTSLVIEEPTPRLLAPGKRVLPVSGGKEAEKETADTADTEKEAAHPEGVEAGASTEEREERAVSSTPRDAALPEQVAVPVSQCPHCSRSFAAPRLAKHAAVCQQAQARKKATPSKEKEKADGGKADGGKAGTPVEERKAEEDRKKSLKWRNESANLRAAMEYNRKLAQAEKAGIDISTLPPPPSQTSDDRVECPHCNRKFNADVADRHIPKCNAKKTLSFGKKSL